MAQAAGRPRGGEGDLSQKHLYESRPYWRRPSFYVTVLTLILLWLGDLAIFSYAVMGAMNQTPYQPLSGLLAFVSLAFGIYIVWFTYTFLTRSLAHYAVAVGEGAVTLFVDPAFGRPVQATVRSQDIEYLEHFTPSDKETLVCHLKDGRIVDIPLWALPTSAQAIVSTLKTPDMRVLTV